MKMKFKNFEFPANPGVIKAGITSNCHSGAQPGKNSVVENVSINPATVEGSGEFYGDDGLEACTRLQKMLREKTSGWLFAPCIVPIKAFLTDFEWQQSSKSKSYSYGFKFVEDCTQKSETENLSFVYASKGQNAFDIAFENGVSVDDIMTLNDLITPFDIEENDRVVLR